MMDTLLSHSYSDEAAKEARTKLFSMWYSLGPPSVFFTISPGDKVHTVEANDVQFILCDSQMVANGITKARLPKNNPIICTLNHPEVTELARQINNTRSAAALELWRPHLAGAVVAIGNAPTALFRLLELLDQNVDKPALILGFPVGFVGAAESKIELATNSRGVPFITLHGRRGGSAIAAAAVNALAKENEL